MYNVQYGDGYNFDVETCPECDGNGVVPSQEEEAPKWEYKKTFAINETMKAVIEATIKTTQSEIDKYRKKLSKLTYGS